MTAPDDEVTQLVQRMAKGDRPALTRLYQLEADRINGILFRIVRDSDTSSDLLHDTFVRLWTASIRFDPSRAAARTWISTIARNIAIDHLRRQEALNRAGPDLKLAVETLHAPAELPDWHENSGRLTGCIERLRKDWQHVLVNGYLNGRTYADLATELNVSVNTVKSWVRRSLAQLKDCLLSKD